MRFIAHRGLIHGPDKNKENTVEQIELALKRGFNVEIDVWYKNDQWYLGHDEPKTIVSEDYIKHPFFWLHAKNNEALERLSFISPQLHYFWHETDDYTMTSAGVIWAYPGQRLFKTSVCVLPESTMTMKETLNLNVYGICSDYIDEIREIYKCKLR